MVSPVVMYGCESWTVKKAECRRIDAFEKSIKAELYSVATILLQLVFHFNCAALQLLMKRYSM